MAMQVLTLKKSDGGGHAKGALYSNFSHHVHLASSKVPDDIYKQDTAQDTSCDTQLYKGARNYQYQTIFSDDLSKWRYN